MHTEYSANRSERYKMIFNEDHSWIEVSIGAKWEDIRDAIDIRMEELRRLKEARLENRLVGRDREIAQSLTDFLRSELKISLQKLGKYEPYIKELTRRINSAQWFNLRYQERNIPDKPIDLSGIDIPELISLMIDPINELRIQRTLLAMAGPVGVINVAAPASSLPNPASERIEAIKFADTIKLVNIANQKDPVILALGTSWIKGYERRNSRQYADINSLIIAIRNYCKERGVTFIDKDDKDLLAEIGKAREANPNARVVVLAGQETITSDEFATLRNDARAFLAGVDSNGIDETCYMRITEMLRMALRLGLRDMLTAIADINNPYIKADPYKTFRNVYIFLPKAEKLPDYDSLRQLYRIQEFA